MTVSVFTTCVVPGVTSDVMLATDLYVPAFFDEASYVTAAEPPGVGPLRFGRHSVLFAGALAMFFPLVPVRFSAPQFMAEPGSPVAALAVPYEIGDLLLRRAPPTLSQISPVWVVALPKFFTAA